jgi:hypothetical protein
MLEENIMNEVGELAADSLDLVGSERLWCNFCGYTTSTLSDYLAHSCVDVLEASGKLVQPTSQNECR